MRMFRAVLSALVAALLVILRLLQITVLRVVVVFVIVVLFLVVGHRPTAELVYAIGHAVRVTEARGSEKEWSAMTTMRGSTSTIKR